jgi:hypothetical protein
LFFNTIFIYYKGKDLFLFYKYLCTKNAVQFMAERQNEKLIFIQVRKLQRKMPGVSICPAQRKAMYRVHAFHALLSLVFSHLSYFAYNRIKLAAIILQSVKLKINTNKVIMPAHPKKYAIKHTV